MPQCRVYLAQYRMNTLSSPNWIVREYFESLRHLVTEVRSAESDAHRRQRAALVVIMSVTAVEVFLNIWFRVRLEERHSQQEIKAFVRELMPPRPLSLEGKIRHWPNRYLGKELDQEAGAGAEFKELKTLRNSIVHFTSTHSTFKHSGIIIHGLADTSAYDSLSFESARHSLIVVEDFLTEIFHLAGASRENVPHMLHAWTGRVPQNAA